MNKIIDALKLAEEAFNYRCTPMSNYSVQTSIAKEKKALATIREALAEQEKQEPVAWWNGKETAWFEHELCGWQAPDGCTIPLYAAQVSAKRGWVNPTPQDVYGLVREGAAGGGWQGFASRLSAWLKEKNNG